MVRLLSVVLLGFLVVPGAWAQQSAAEKATVDFQLLDAYLKYLGNQTDSVLAMSAVGLTGVAIFFMRRIRSLGGWHLFSLFVSAASFLVSIGTGYVIEAASTGFFYEVIAGKGGCSPETATACFLDEGDEGYVEKFWRLVPLQFFSSFSGFVWLVLPVLYVYWPDRRKREKLAGG